MNVVFPSVLLVIIGIFLFVTMILKIRISKNLYLIISFLGILSLSSVAFMFIPGGTSYFSTFDLTRYFWEVNDLRTEGVTYLLKILKSSFEPMRYIYFYLISLTNSNHWLTFCNALLIYSMLGYVFIDGYLSFNENNLEKRPQISKQKILIRTDELVIIIILMFSMNHFAEIINTIRADLAFTTSGFVIYLYYRKKINLFVTTAIMLSAVLLQSGAIIAVSIFFIYKLFPQIYRYRYLIILWQLMLNVIVTILSKIDNFYVHYLITTLMDIIKINAFGMQVYWITAIALLITIDLICNNIIKDNVDDKAASIIKLNQIMIAFTIGSYHTMIFIRMFFLLAVLTPFVIHYANIVLNKKKKKILFWPMIICALGLIAYHTSIFIIRIMVSNSTWM